METPKIPNTTADWKLNSNVESRIILDKLEIKTPECRTLEFCRTLRNLSVSIENTPAVSRSKDMHFKSEFVLDVLLNEILGKCEEKCKVCEEYVQQLRHHIILAHSGHPNPSPHPQTVTVFKCDVCSSIYSSPSMLIRHRNTHSNPNNSDTLTTPCTNESRPVQFDSNNIYASFDISSVTRTNESVSAVQYENHPHQPVPVSTMNFEWNCLKQEELSSSQSELEMSNPNTLGILEHMYHLSTIENNLKQECDVLECQEDLMDPLLLQDLDVQVPSFAKSEWTGMSTEFEQQRAFTTLTHEKSSNDTLAGRETFPVPLNLVRHEMTQSSQKPHKCDRCAKFFSSSRQLTQHKSTHSGKRPHACDVCGKCFRQRFSLTRHKLAHTSDTRTTREANNAHSENSDTPCTNEPEPVRLDSNNIYGSFDISSVTKKNESASSVQYENNPLQPITVPPMNVEWNCLKQEPQESQSEMEMSRPNPLGILQHLNHLSTIENNLKQECDDLESQEDLHDPLLLKDIDIQVHPFVKYECIGMSTESEQQTVLMTQSSNDTTAGGESFPVPLDLITHKLIHSRIGKEPRKCDVCGKCFGKSSTLTRHKRTHTGEKSFRCDECGRRFALGHNLANHKLIHTGERPHKCDVCGMCFAQRSNLTRHKLTHTGERLHKCDVCGQGFSQRSVLMRHNLTHTEEKPHKCDVCGQGFNQRSQLTQHKAVHTGEKTHECNVCGKCFFTQSNLNKHKLIHTGEKRHKCDVCGKCFALNSYLTEHKSIHTGVRPHKCDRCEKSFKQSAHLAKHKLTHTRVTEETSFRCDECGQNIHGRHEITKHKLKHAWQSTTTTLVNHLKEELESEEEGCQEDPLLNLEVSS